MRQVDAVPRLLWVVMDCTKYPFRPVANFNMRVEARKYIGDASGYAVFRFVWEETR